MLQLKICVSPGYSRDPLCIRTVKVRAIRHLHCLHCAKTC